MGELGELGVGLDLLPPRLFNRFASLFTWPPLPFVSTENAGLERAVGEEDDDDADDPADENIEDISLSTRSSQSHNYQRVFRVLIMFLEEIF